MVVAHVFAHLEKNLRRVRKRYDREIEPKGLHNENAEKQFRKSNGERRNERDQSGEGAKTSKNRE